MIDWTFTGLTAVALIATSALINIAPYLPLITESKNISSTVTGIIFSSHPFMACIFLPIYGSMMARIGRKKLLLGSILLEVISLITLSTFPYFDSESFAILAIVSRGIHGIGSAGVSSTILALMSTTYKDKLPSKLGNYYIILSTSLIFAPLLGSLFYLFGGFTAVYWGFTFLLIFTTVFAAIVIPKDKPYRPTEIKVTWSSILRLRTPNLDFLCIFFCFVGYSSIETSISTYLSNELNIHQSIIPLFFSITPLFWSLGSFAAGRVYGKMKNKLLLFFCLLTIIFSLELIGPASFIPINSNLISVIISLAGMGFCVGSAMVVSLPDMIEDTMINAPYLQRDHVSDRISAWLDLGLWIGRMVGPLIAGYLKDQIGFRDTEATIGFFIIIFALIFKIFSKEYSKTFDYDNPLIQKK